MTSMFLLIMRHYALEKMLEIKKLEEVKYLFLY